MAFHLTRGKKVLAGFTAVLVLVAGFTVYQLYNRGAPSFRRGGEFVTKVADAGSTTSTALLTSTSSGSTSSSATTLGTTASSATSRSVVTTPRTSGPRASKSISTATAPTTTTMTTAAEATASPGTVPVPRTGPRPSKSPAGPRLPAFGQYVYAVEGEESVSIMGSRRFPDEMVTVVHGAPDLAPDQAVFDLTYSDSHEEREIVGFRDDGIYFDFEGGSVSFGPRTETNEADYDPPMLQIPAPLQAGSVRTGVSKATKPDGSPSRTENWTVKVLGQERLQIEGAAVETWKVEVDRRFDGAESGTRKRTYWFDPARLIWVKFTEVFHGERKTGGFKFEYDANITATLRTFRPA